MSFHTLSSSQGREALSLSALDVISLSGLGNLIGKMSTGF